MSQATPLEEKILAEIKARTGLIFRHIGGIPTRDKDVADAVLPILAELPPTIEDANHRHGIYACFHTPHAVPYIDKLISWWETEPYELAHDTLEQTLAGLARPEHAARLWNTYKRLGLGPRGYFLLAALARFPSVADEVKDVIVEGLARPDVRAAYVEAIAKVDDPRIRRWFEANTNHRDRYVRLVVKRFLNRRRALPRGIERSRTAPDRNRELFSTEVDVSEMKPLLRQIVVEFGVNIPSAIARGSFLSRLEVNEWVVATTETATGGQASLWFRLEDIDVVEVVLTTGDAGAAQRTS